MYINHDTKIIHIDYPNLHDSNPSQKDKICLPLKLFHAVFNKLHAHGHSGIKISIKVYNQFYFIPYLHKWMSILIHECSECQQNKHINQKFKPQQYKFFSENVSYFNYRITMDTKGPINPPSKQISYIHVIVDAFSHFVVRVPIKQNIAQTADNPLLHIGLPNLNLLYVQLQTVVQNTLTLNLQSFVPQWNQAFTKNSKDKWFS